MTDITIPDEVVEVAARASYDEHRREYNSAALECNYAPWEDEWSDLLLSERMQWMAEARAAILAALKAWPGVEKRRVTDFAIPPMPECYDRTMPAIILPLTQETNA